MREHMGLFRGNLKASNEWAFGNLQVTKSGVAIITPDDTPIGKYGQVDPETVGECAGLKDKNGKLIFEGDILKNEYAEGSFQYVKVIYDERYFRWDIENKYGFTGRLYNVIGNFEVIGNIHDNPELLEESNES